MKHPVIDLTLSAGGQTMLMSRLTRILLYRNYSATIADLFEWLQCNVGLSEDDALNVVSLAADHNIPDRAVVRQHLLTLYHALGGDNTLIMQS